MVAIGVRELREHLSAALRRVRAGESLVVTSHGEPIAMLSPPPRDPYEELVRSGAVTPARKPFRVADFEPLPQIGAISASEALAEDRDDR